MFLLSVNVNLIREKKTLVFFGAFEKFRKAIISFIMPVRPSAPNGRMFMKFLMCVFL